MSIFVIDSRGTPLLPTTARRARILLEKKVATVFSVIPFTIRLNRSVATPVGAFSVGIDDGAKFVGISVAHKNNIVFAGKIRLRQDVPKKMLQRSQFRRTRRTRNLRHRAARFLNRGSSGWLPPTIKQKKESICRVISFLIQRLHITSCVVEQGQFDISSMSAGYKLTNKEYQLSAYIGNTWRQKVLWRDNYQCQICYSNKYLQAHHIVYKARGGSNRVINGITLCKHCHEQVHLKQQVLSPTNNRYKHPAHTQQGKNYLYRRLQNYFDKVNVCFGWMTARARKKLSLDKDHHHDASAMINANNYNCCIYIINPRRTKIWENNPTKKCTEKHGFKHFDFIKSCRGKRKKITGYIRSLCKKEIRIRTSFDDNFSVSYTKSKVLWRPKGLLFIRVD